MLYFNDRRQSQELPILSEAYFDFCGIKCHKPNITVQLALKSKPNKSFINSKGASNNNYLDRTNELNLYESIDLNQEQASINCDRDPYTMVSKRKICGKLTNSNIHKSYISIYIERERD